MKRLAYNVLAFCSAWIAVIAYVIGIIRIGEWVWGLVSAAHRANWYGLKQISYLPEVLAVVLLLTGFFMAVYFLFMLPISILTLVYSNIKGSGESGESRL